MYEERKLRGRFEYNAGIRGVFYRGCCSYLCCQVRVGVDLSCSCVILY